MMIFELSKFERLKASGNLPSPKGVALAIVRLTQKDDASMADLARVVKSDPAFVGRLIKAANSVNMLPGRPVVSVQDALMVLGMSAVRNLALSLSLLSQFAQGACKNFDYSCFWSSSLAGALAFQALTTRTRAAATEEAFSVGLLARIGELALATSFPIEYAELLSNAANQESAHLLRAETRTFGLDHQSLSVAMMVDWGIPANFAEPVGCHENPDTSEYSEGSRQYLLLHSLALARQIARVCTAAETDRAALMPDLYKAGSRVGLDAATLSPLCDSVVRDWVDWGRMLNVAANPLPPFEELAKPRSSTEVQIPVTDDNQRLLRLLLITDKQTERDSMLEALKSDGYELHWTIDGSEASRAVLETYPHLMVLDWKLPRLDGLDLVRSVRQTNFGRDMYILILVEPEDEDKVMEAFEVGVNDYMTKPTKPALLAARLRTGQRIVRLQDEVERDRENIRHFAAELAVTNRRLQEVALTDALTGFPNRRYAMERIQQEWSAADRAKRPLVCMVANLDHFKQVNDVYGQDVGDIYIKQTAAAIRKSVRAQDVICRTGGDEFLIICPDTELSAGLSCAERMRRLVETSPVRAGMLRLNATISVGVSMRVDGMKSPDELMKQAEQSLQQARQNGRNRVESDLS